MKSFKTFTESKEFETFKNWQEHTKTFKPGDRTFVGKNRNKYIVKVAKASTGSQYYTVHHKKDEVGPFYVRSNGLNTISVMNAGVEPEHQRQGIASHVYRTIENDSKHTGMELVPQNFNSGETSDDAKALWRHLKPEKYK